MKLLCFLIFFFFFKAQLGYSSSFLPSSEDVALCNSDQRLALLQFKNMMSFSCAINYCIIDGDLVRNFR